MIDTRQLLRLDWRSALGQFAIIVVGVLVALAADRWNQDRQDRLTEAQYIGALIDDLEADTAAIARALDLVTNFVAHGRRVVQVLEGADWAGTPDDLARAVEYSLYLPFPDGFARATFQDLQSTGNLGLIRSDSLRKTLTRYYGAVEGVEGWLPVWLEAQRPGLQLLPVFLSLNQRMALSGEYGATFGGPPLPHVFQEPGVTEVEDLSVSDAEADELVRALREHSEYQAVLENMIYMDSWIWNELTILRAQAITTLAALEQSMG